MLVLMLMHKDYSATSIVVGQGYWCDRWHCLERERDRERSTRGDRVLFSSVGLWEGFLGVKITRIPYHFVGCDPMVGGLPPIYLC